jgi:hypothetical protein
MMLAIQTSAGSERRRGPSRSRRLGRSQPPGIPRASAKAGLGPAVGNEDLQSADTCGVRKVVAGILAEYRGGSRGQPTRAPWPVLQGSKWPKERVGRIYSLLLCPAGQRDALTVFFGANVQSVSRISPQRRRDC